MIDLIYKTLLTIINKENQGYISPTEFNIIANNVQYEIFRNYFEDENRDKNKENKGLTNTGFSNLDFNQRQMIEQFAADTILTINSDNHFDLPEDLYFIIDDGVTTLNPPLEEGQEELYQDDIIIDEEERSNLGYLKRSIAKPTKLFPVYTRYSDYIKVLPLDIKRVNLEYLRKPKKPNWTFVKLPSGSEMFNPADVSFQDFELHSSEFSNIVLKMLSYFGLNLREQDVIQIAETLKDKMNIKDNG